MELWGRRFRWEWASPLLPSITGRRECALRLTEMVRPIRDRSSRCTTWPNCGTRRAFLSARTTGTEWEPVRSVLRPMSTTTPVEMPCPESGSTEWTCWRSARLPDLPSSTATVARDLFCWRRPPIATRDIPCRIREPATDRVTKSPKCAKRVIRSLRCARRSSRTNWPRPKS
uniref:(northern house mosquito) hypothetical protein n=1 Tax=Culex pipiens TaxID=7175 RepID=A0A8D8DKY5_CULPI